MATNTSATSQNHNGTGSQANFAISFPFLLNSEIEVTVGGVLKTLGTHYNIVGSEVQFTSDNIPASGIANVVFNRDTNISTKRVDFEDGSVLTEADLDNNVNQVLFAQQELSNDYVKRDGSQTITGNLVFEGSVDDTNETTLAITNPTADRTITIPDVTGSVVTTGDTGTVAHTMLANDAVDGDNIADDSINSEHYVGLSIDTEHIANENVTTAKLENNAVSNSKLGDNAVDSRNYVDGSIDHEHLANDIIDGDNIQDDVINSEHYVAGSIDHEHLANDIIDGDNIQDDVINSEHYVAGSIDHEHLANDIIDGDNVQDNAINNEHIAANAVRVNEIKDGEITSAKLNPSTVITASEQASATTNDTSFLTSAAADARFFNISTGDTIKDGDTFPDNDTTIATTAAINDRIIDLIDDVGGFTIIASEQAFPDVNPQGVTGQAAVLSIKAATTNLVPSGTTVTITNGNVADNADITITGVTSTIPSGFGFLVESTTTLHTYAFHRLVPKATEVTSVAGKAVEIGRLGTADAVADMAILGTTDVVADMAILATNDVVADMNTLATADIVSDMNTLAVADVISDMDTVATNVTNVNNVGNNVTNVNSVSNSAGANQTFTVTVQNVSGNKYFIDGVQTPVLKLARGKTYTFDMSDSSNSGHPLAFRDSSDNSYTTGVTTSGTAGSSGATVVIVVAANAPSSLKYYCTSHGNAMGNTINVIDDNVGIVAGSITNVNEVGDDITNVNSVAGSITNVNTVASNINNVNSFFNTYRIGANNPTDNLDVGDLFFNTTSDSLKVYTGSAWVDGVTATGNFAVVTGNTFTGSNNHNDNVKSIYGTGSDLEIYHNTDNSYINNTNGTLRILSNNHIVLEQLDGDNLLRCDQDGAVKLYYDNSEKFETTSTGVSVTGNVAVSGNVDGRDLAADGTKLDGIESGATADQTASDIKTLLNSSGLVNAQIDASAAIDGTKISPNFGSQHIQTSGDLRIIGSYPNILLTDSDNDSDFRITNANGSFLIYDITNTATRFTVNSDGHIDVAGNLDVGAGLDVTGATSTQSLTISANQVLGHGNSTGNQIKFTRSGLGDELVIGTDGYGSSTQYEATIQSSIVTARPLVFRTNNTDRIRIASGGTVDISGNLDVGAGLDVTGNITVSGTVDGVDIAALNTTVGNITTDLVTDTTPQLGGDLQTNGNDIDFADADKAIFGTNGDLKIYHDNFNNANDILSEIGQLNIKGSGSNPVKILNPYNKNALVSNANGSIELYHNNSKKFETTSSGAKVNGNLVINDGNQIQLQNSVANRSSEIVNGGSSTNSDIQFRTNGTHRATVAKEGHFEPALNNTYDLGVSNLRWRNIYTNDLNLSNEGGSNDVDGTWGSYTIQEGAEDLFLINKRNGKKYKFNLTEVS